MSLMTWHKQLKKLEELDRDLRVYRMSPKGLSPSSYTYNLVQLYHESHRRGSLLLHTILVQIVTIVLVLAALALRR